MSKQDLDTDTSQIMKVYLDRLLVSPRAQRRLRPARVDELAAEFQYDNMGYLVLNQRGKNFYIIDGQHRFEALKKWYGDGWETIDIPCRVYKGLTEQQEAEKFDRLNNSLQVNAFDKFNVRVTAGRQEETTIKRIVTDNGLCISQDKVPGAISAVSALRKLYVGSNAETLAKTLRVIRDSFGDAGFEAMVITGIGLLCQRYNGILDEREAVQRLSKTNGGVKGLLGRAEVLHRQTGNAKSQCVAAAAVDVINSKRGGKKLPGWWKSGKEVA